MDTVRRGLGNALGVVGTGGPRAKKVAKISPVLIGFHGGAACILMVYNLLRSWPEVVKEKPGRATKTRLFRSTAVLADQAS